MKTDQEIQTKIKELEESLEGVDEEFEETLDDEGIDEFSDQGAELEHQFDQKKEVIEDQVKLLKWVLE